MAQDRRGQFDRSREAVRLRRLVLFGYVVFCALIGLCVYGLIQTF
jgi:hypothetical protein